jgi:potassium-dependent mechanosensitive channel
MNVLLITIVSWFSYLERPEVVLQLAVCLAVPVLIRLGRRRRWLGGCPPAGYTLAGVGVLAAVCGLMQLLGLPNGLALQLSGLWLGWHGLNRFAHLLHRWLPHDRVQHLNSRLLRPVFLSGAAYLMISNVDSVPQLAVIQLGTVMGVPLYLGKLVDSVVVIYLVLVGSGPPAAAVAWLLQRSLSLSPGSRKASELLLQYLAVALGLIAVAVQRGLNSTALIAVAGGLSVGLGFGIKEVFSNFVSGLWLLFEGSVRPGEVLMIDGDPCEVRRLGPRATLLWRDRDNAELLIPNQSFFTDRATTYTATDRMRRSQVSVGVAYRHPPDAVIALLEAIALEVPRVLSSPAPKALLLSYGDSAINYALRFWIDSPMDNVGICSEVNQKIWQVFRREGIEIPFPQQVQHRIPSLPAPPQDEASLRR